MARIAKEKEAFFQLSYGSSPKVNNFAYNTGCFKGESSEAIIAFDVDLYHFTLDNPAEAVPYGVSGSEFLNSAEYLDGHYYISTSSGTFMQCDPETGALTQISSGNAYQVIAFNPSDGLMYGILAGANSSIYTVDVSTGLGTLIRPINSENFLIGVSIDNEGRMFVVDATADGISEIDIMTGDIIASQPAGFMVNYGQDLDVDRETNQLYWAAFNVDANQSQLYKVDFDEADFELIGFFVSQASCFASMTISNLDVPSVPTNLTSVAGPDGAMYADISWTNPTTTISGDPLTEITSIVLRKNGNIVSNFSDVTPGQSMTYHDEDFSEAGLYVYSVQAVNDAGNGRSAVAPAVTVGPMCAITVNMVDAYGDGWNGAFLGFTLEDGTAIASCTCSGPTSAVDVLLPTGSVINLVWNSGEYDEECGFQLFLPWDDILYEHPLGSPLTSGVIFTWDNTCMPPSCPSPIDLTSSNIIDGSVDLSWTERGDATTWQIEYGVKGFAHGEGTIVEVYENPYSLLGLENGVTFDVYVKSVCGPEDHSEWSDKNSFHTPIYCGEGYTAATIQIGEGIDGAYNMPVNTFYGYSYVQELFTSAELSEQGAFFGEINSLSFEYTFPSSMRPTQLTILLGNTEATNLASGWQTNNMQLVYDGNPTFEQGWIEIPFDTPFLYDGSGSVVVTFVYERQPYIGSDFRFLTHTTEEACSRVLFNDGSGYDPFSPSEPGASTTTRNNIVFNMCITEPNFVTVSGTVTSSYTGEVVSGATVKFQGAIGSTVTTNTNGEYTIELVQEFDYLVTINAEGCNPLTEVYTTPAAETATKDFTINQPDIVVDPLFVDESAYFMQTVTKEISITNTGTGDLEWNAKAFIGDGKHSESDAHVALGGITMYDFTLSDPESATPNGALAFEFINSAVWVDGVAYFISSSVGFYGTIDYEGGFMSIFTLSNPYNSLGYDSKSGTLYGISCGAGPVVYTVDIATGEATEAFTINSDDYILGIEFDNNGRMFAIDSDINGIAEIDPTTGDLTPLITANWTVNYGQDLEMDREENILYWAAFNATASQGQLYSIDLANPTLNLVGVFADQASALVIETTMGTVGPWLSVSPNHGFVAPGETSTFDISMDGWHAEEGTFTGYVDVYSNTINATTSLPVTFNIMAPPCESVSNLAGEIEDFNNVILTWDAPAGAIACNLYYGDDHEPFAVVEDNYYTDESLKPGVYSYNVRAVYEDGCISASPETIVMETTQPYRVVSGVVTSSLTNDPIEGASIIFEGTTYVGSSSAFAMTDVNGAYNCNVFDGVYSVSVQAYGFNSATVDELVVEDEPIYNYNFVLDQPIISIDPSEVNVQVEHMNQGIAEIFITNNGTGDLTWTAFTACDPIEKGDDSYAICALGGTEMYEFTLNDPSNASPLNFSAPEFLNSAVYVDGVYYFATSTTGMFGIIDLRGKSFEVISSGNPYSGLGFDVVSNTIYGASLGSNSVIYAVDPSTGVGTQSSVVNSPCFILGIEFDNYGRMFAIDAELDGISEIDPTTGEVYPFISLGWETNYGQDLAVDRENNIIYWAAVNVTEGQAQLYAIDPDEYTITFIGPFVDQASCFAIESSAGWMKALPNAGVVSAGETGTFEIVMDGWLAEEGVFTGSCSIANNTFDSYIVLPVTFAITLPHCDPVENLTCEVLDYNDIVLSWDAPSNAENLLSYGVYYGDDKVAFAIVDAAETSYTDWNLAPGEYTYRVRAMYEDGCVSQSLELVGAETTAEYGVVAGTITDATDGSPIEGAEVKFNNSLITYTDQDGAYEIELETGTYTNVSISAEYYSTVVIPEVVVVIYDNNLDVALESIFTPAQDVVAVVDNKDVLLSWETPEETKFNYDVIDLSGYMISRNGEEIDTVDPTVLTYTDANLLDGDYTYCVTAVYGENLAHEACAEEITVGGGTVLLGDANDNGTVMIDDIQTIIAYILMQNPSPFNFINADVNQDGSINIPDVQGVISIILAFKGTCETTEVSYTVENGVLYMINNGPVSAFQISLNSDNFKALESFDSWTTAEGMTEDGYLFLAYNLDGKEFAAGKHALLAVNETVNSVLVSDPCANAIICKNILGLGENVTISAAYPNPFNTTVTFNYTANNDSNVEFVVTSMVGQVVYRSNSNNGTFTWTPSNVSNGVYFINVYVNGERAQVSKVVYQK